MTRFVLISDTHNHLHHIQDRLPEGDVLIHAGDITSMGREHELRRQARAFKEIKPRYKHIVAVFGNHEREAQKNPGLHRLIMEETGVTLLENETKMVEGFKVFGSPYSPSFGVGWGFNADRGEKIKRYWDLIENGTDIVVAHGPPLGWGDEVKTMYNVVDLDGEWEVREEVEHVGCEDLLRAIERARPWMVVSGHIHSGHGKRLHPQGTIIVNASILNEQYKIAYDPIVVEL